VSKGYSTGAALLSGLGLVRCGVCGEPVVVQYNAPTRLQRGRVTPTTPFCYTCTRRDARALAKSCQAPAGPYIDRAVAALILRELSELDLAGYEDTLRDRDRRIAAESPGVLRCSKAPSPTPAGRMPARVSPSASRRRWPS
jgi:hypothetical protein